SRANASAMPRPMPFVPPVTTATLPVKFIANRCGGWVTQTEVYVQPPTLKCQTENSPPTAGATPALPANQGRQERLLHRARRQRNAAIKNHAKLGARLHFRFLFLFQ